MLGKLAACGVGLVLLAWGLAPPAAASARGTPAWACFALAPDATSCTSAVNTAGAFGVFGINDDCLSGCLRHGVDGLAYEGTVESHLNWSGGERVFRCTYANGTSTITATCEGYGLWPPLGTPFTQVCMSRDRGTDQPGGSGLFGCHMTHG
ncbi:MAG: hypothetical protein LC624_00295 [Halobacteriales archaeon]|nr:hypothetical protein [Halobacteriales archaeon]